MTQNNDITSESYTGDIRCSICSELLDKLSQFFKALNIEQRNHPNEWLTVDDIASELKLSKSIVYRMIRQGELEAVNLVDTGGKIAQKGHYRIKRKSLEQYLEQKTVKLMHQPPSRPRRQLPLLKVKNHLGL